MAIHRFETDADIINFDVSTLVAEDVLKHPNHDDETMVNFFSHFHKKTLTLSPINPGTLLYARVGAGASFVRAIEDLGN